MFQGLKNHFDLSPYQVGRAYPVFDEVKGGRALHVYLVL